MEWFEKFRFSKKSNDKKIIFGKTLKHGKSMKVSLKIIRDFFM